MLFHDGPLQMVSKRFVQVLDIFVQLHAQNLLFLCIPRTPGNMKAEVAITQKSLRKQTQLPHNPDDICLKGLAVEWASAYQG
jgi:hypothetical protein